MRYRHIFGVGAFIALFIIMSMPAEGQVNVERLESIARHVARAILAEGDSLTVEQVAWVERMTAQLAEDVAFLDEQKQRLEDVRRERDASIRNIASQVAKGIAVLIALLVLWAIFRVFRRGLRAESGDDPLGVLIAMRTEARAQKLGEALVEENLGDGRNSCAEYPFNLSQGGWGARSCGGDGFFEDDAGATQRFDGPSRGIGRGQDARTGCDT